MSGEQSIQTIGTIFLRGDDCGFTYLCLDVLKRHSGQPVDINICPAPSSDVDIHGPTLIPRGKERSDPK